MTYEQESRNYYKEVNDILNNLKQSKLSKNTYLLNEEDKAKLEKYINEIKITNRDFQETKLLSVTIDNIKDQLDDDKKIIKFYEDNNSALSTRNNILNKKINEQEKIINELEEDIKSIEKDNFEL